MMDLQLISEKEAKEIVESKETTFEDFELNETIYDDFIETQMNDDGIFSIEDTNVDNIFYITRSYDAGTSYEYYKTVEYTGKLSYRN